MNPTKFDEVTKALATATSRRQALKTIAATTLGSILGLAGIGTALAAPKCHRNGLGCDTNSNCCSGNCQNGKCVPCIDLGQPCTSDSQCCLGSCDPSTQVCSGCFTAGTVIAMADGTSRPIEHVLVDDLVLGSAGRVNRVAEVLRPVLGHRHLYALNESNFFVTAGHPFMTEEGWKAIDPAATPAGLSALRVGRLTVGDRLLTLTAAAVPVGRGRASSAEAVDVRIEAVALQSLVGQPADPATQLYNLRLDGDHTYFANDLLVHNK